MNETNSINRPSLDAMFHFVYRIDTMTRDVQLIVDHRFHLEDREEEKLNQNVIIMLVTDEYYQ